MCIASLLSLCEGPVEVATKRGRPIYSRLAETLSFVLARRSASRGKSVFSECVSARPRTLGPRLALLLRATLACLVFLSRPLFPPRVLLLCQSVVYLVPCFRSRTLTQQERRHALRYR